MTPNEQYQVERAALCYAYGRADGRISYDEPMVSPADFVERFVSDAAGEPLNWGRLEMVYNQMLTEQQ